MRQLRDLLAIGGAVAAVLATALASQPTSHGFRAAAPPMGWNSYDCFGSSVTEAEVRANAKYMAAHLRRFGWRYIVIDAGWYRPDPAHRPQDPNAALVMDAFGRLTPTTDRFPSAANGKGFAPLAGCCHRLGLKFGVHVMRGVPRQAALTSAPILGTNANASQIADRTSLCDWNDSMFGVDAACPGAQPYYDSLFRLYAAWGIDYVKVDDLTEPYHAGEIELIRKAIDRCGRPIAFSGSPGPTPLASAAHVRANLDLWRVSDDLWDRWKDLHAAFELADSWSRYAGGGRWPDLDMLPLGRIGARSVDGDRRTRLTGDEQITLMTLWLIARSPLMFGGDLPNNDPFTLSLLTNGDALAVGRASSNNRQLFRRGDLVCWVAERAGGGRYVALFNLGSDPARMGATFAELGAGKPRGVRDLWKRREIRSTGGRVQVDLPAHGAALLRLTRGEAEVREASPRRAGR